MTRLLPERDPHRECLSSPAGDPGSRRRCRADRGIGRSVRDRAADRTGLRARSRTLRGDRRVLRSRLCVAEIGPRGLARRPGSSGVTNCSGCRHFCAPRRMRGRRSANSATVSRSPDIFLRAMCSTRAGSRCRKRGSTSSPRLRGRYRTRPERNSKRPVARLASPFRHVLAKSEAAPAPEAAAPVVNADRAADRPDDARRDIDRAAVAAGAAATPVADAAALHRLGLRIVELAQRIRDRRAARGRCRRPLVAASDNPATINSAIKKLLISLSPVNWTMSVRVPASGMIAKKSRPTHSSLVH